MQEIYGDGVFEVQGPRRMAKLNSVASEKDAPEKTGHFEI